MSNEIIANSRSLELSFQTVDLAMRHGTKASKIKAIQTAVNSGCIDEKLYLAEAELVFKKNGIRDFHLSNLSRLDDKSLRLCTIGCRNAIVKKLLSNDYYLSQYSVAYNEIFVQEHKFEADRVLHTDDKGNSLKVADLLSVLDYSLTIAKAIKPNDENYKGIETTKTVLKAIDLALNNKPEDKPINKMLHLAVGFISGAVRESLSNTQDKRNVSIGEGLLKLAIDFFCKK